MAVFLDLSPSVVQIRGEAPGYGETAAWCFDEIMGRSKEAAVEQALREIAEDPEAPSRRRGAARKRLEERPRS